MGNRSKIFVGEKSGRRIVVTIDPAGTARHMRVIVQCDCGSSPQSVTVTTFRQTISCRKCSTRPYKRKYGNRVIQGEKLYQIWIGMRRRCDPSVEPERNARWAGRGITVCSEWQDSFDVFEKWALEQGYKHGMSIDRVDVNGNYEPPNCEIVTRSENSKRMRAGYMLVPKRIDKAIANGLLSFGA